MNFIDWSLMGISFAGLLLLLFLLFQRGLYRTFPIFTSYIVFSLISDIAFLFVVRHISQAHYFVVYFADNIIEFLLQLGILIEVARNVLNPVKQSLPKLSLKLFAGMLIGGTIVAVLLSLRSSPEELSRWARYFVQFNFTFAILRLVIFSAIVGFSQMLGIGWKNHVLQIATGFAGYSMVILLVEMVHRYFGVTDGYLYHLHEQIRIVGWCMSIGYWSYVLGKNEAPRKEFSPRMASFLISIAHAARVDRANADRIYRK